MVNIGANLGSYAVDVVQDNMSRSTLHIEIETEEVNISLYADKEKIRDFIKHLQESLEEYEKCCG